MSEWKPGDVAARGSGRPALRTETGWAYADGSVGGLHQDAYTSARPLVVIDPEDAEQVERLLSSYLYAYDGAGSVPQSGDVACLRQALREFAAPTPRIEEPQGLGAVVEEDHGGGVLLLYVNTPNGWIAEDGEEFAWSDLRPVRVLSEGVTP